MELSQLQWLTRELALHATLVTLMYTESTLQGAKLLSHQKKYPLVGSKDVGLLGRPHKFEDPVLRGVYIMETSILEIPI